MLDSQHLELRRLEVQEHLLLHQQQELEASRLERENPQQLVSLPGSTAEELSQQIGLQPQTSSHPESPS